MCVIVITLLRQRICSHVTCTVADTLLFCSSLNACVKMALSSSDINSVGMMAGSWLDLRRYSICRVAKSHVMTGDTLVEVCWHNAYVHWLFEMSRVFLNACTHCLTNTRKLYVRPLCPETSTVMWRAPPCVQQLWQEVISCVAWLPANCKTVRSVACGIERVNCSLN